MAFKALWWDERWLLPTISPNTVHPIAKGQILLTKLILSKLQISNFKANISVTLMNVTDEDLEAALEVALTTKVDLILVASPGYVGADLAFVRALREAGPQTPILMLLSHYTMPTLANLTKINVQGVLTTQAKPEELEKAIEEVSKQQPGILKQ